MRIIVDDRVGVGHVELWEVDAGEITSRGAERAVAELNSTPATSYARAAREWAPLDWWKLEARALHHLPRLRRALAFFAPSAAWRDLGASVAPAWGCLVTLSHIASFVLPIIAFLLIVPWVFDRDDIAQVGVAGILAGIAAVLGGNGLITEVRESLGTDPGIHRLLGALHLIPSVLAAGVAVLAISEEAAAGAFGVLGLVADVVVGLLHFLLFRGPAHRGSDRWRRNLKRLEEAVESMPPAERARVSADLQGALEVLAERGLIDGAEWDRARGVRIGLLGISMAPREDMTPR